MTRKGAVNCLALDAALEPGVGQPIEQHPDRVTPGNEVVARSSVAEGKRRTGAARKTALPKTEDTASQALPPIGTRLNHARLLRRLRLEDVAEAAGCSASMVSKIENNKVSPSLTTLHKLCTALQMSVSTLFSAAGGADQIVLRPHERPLVGNMEAPHQRGAKAEILAPHAEGRLLEGLLVILEPGAGSEGNLQHRGEEIGYVLEGVLDLTVDGRHHRLNPGDSFCFSSETPHSYSDPGRHTTKVVWVNTPPTL